MTKYEVKKMTVRELLTSNMDIDIDVYDNVCEELGVAFCPPMYLTEEGIEKFGRLLDSEVEICVETCSAVLIVDDDPEWEWEDKLELAKEFFYAMAGYCNEDDYDKWFQEY